ncbi:MAG: thioesterase family protein [Paraglaciecola sp.]|uniref:acyl-CoA thioesterase n=1 Tax=Paraglaciecola sp. TaxID=1920173 RepID=UPI0032662A09
MSNQVSKKPTLPQLSDYQHFINIDTRWMDNDVYGHVNNVVYYSYFDTAINHYLIEQGNLDIHQGPTIGLMISSQCAFHSSVAFPDKLIAGFGVNKIGNSSVEYNIAIFKKEQTTASASGTMTHVFVDRATNKPVPISGELRKALNTALLA